MAPVYLPVGLEYLYAVRVTDKDRGDSIARRMDRLGIPVSDLAERLGVDRQTIDRARAGRSHPATFGKIEAWLDDFEHEVGADTEAPPDSGGLVEFELEGVFGVARVVVKGPVGDIDLLRDQVARLVNQMRERPVSAPD